MRKKNLIKLELFSGTGGFRKGLENAGFTFKKVLFSEIDKHAIANYKYNFKNSTYAGSVQEIKGSQLPKIDIITFGSPCQDFSIAGKGKGLDGDRSSLIREAIRIIAECRPPVFIWENVKGAYSSNQGRDFQAILQAFADIGGYRLEWQLLNTKWVLPQNRERIYLVGHLAGRSVGQIFPFRENDKLSTSSKFTKKGRTQTENSTCLKASGSIKSDDTFVLIPDNANCLTAGGNSGGLHSDMTVIPIGKVIQVNRTNKESNKSQPYQQNRVYNPQGVSPALLGGMSCGSHKIEVKPVLTPNRKVKRQNGRRIKNDGEPAFTLNCQDKHGVMVGSKIRRLTEIECERLQGFPDDWTKYGVYEGVIKEISMTQRYRILGNAVSSDIVELIGNRLIFK